MPTCVSTELACPLCGSFAVLRTGRDVYPHVDDHRDKRFWVCPDRTCDTMVGCHPRSDVPLGTLADKRTRRARGRAHAALDPIWRARQARGEWDARTRVYEWLAGKLGIDPRQCHIGMMNIDMCHAVIAICQKYARR